MNDIETIEPLETIKKRERGLFFEKLDIWFFIRLLAVICGACLLVIKRDLFFAKRGDYDQINYMCGIVFTGLALVFSVFRIKVRKKNRLVLSLVHVLLSAVLSYYTMEVLAFADIIKAEIQAVFINIAIILVIYLFFFVITNRIRASLYLGSAVVFALAVTNHLVYLFRGTPFLPNDIYATGTAMSVLGNMKYDMSYNTILGVLAMMLNLIIISKVDYSDDRLKVQILGKTIGGAVVAAALFIMFNTSALTEAGVTISYWNSVKTVNSAGELMQIAVYINRSVVEKPEGYSLANVRKIEKNYEGIEQDDDAVKPNIIVIMNEAFSDLSVIKKFDTNEDYMPFIRSLKNDRHTIMGDMIASIKGGGTANTEFEFLTGNTTGFLPAASIPYQQYIHSDTPTMAYILRQQGYTAIASHPYFATGWRRSSVYPLMGFESFRSAEDWPKNAQKGRLNLISDKANYEYLISLFEQKKEDEKLFLFNVTMQNHSGYSTDYNFPDRITVNGSDDLNAEVYLSLIKESDKAFKYLIEYFEQVDEPTMIVMFGDHQPGDMNNFLDELSKDLTDTVRDTSKLYIVPYIIWTNYDLEKTLEDPELISANYLGSVVMDLANADLPAYNQFLLELRKKYPVISSRITITPDGKYVNTRRELDRSDDIRAYQILEYNSMFDTMNRNHKFFYGYEEE